MMKYKYVIGGSSEDYYVASYNDIINMEGVEYHEKMVSSTNPLVDFLYRKHFSPKINSIINLPGKAFWNRFILRHKFDKNDSICFILFSYYTSGIELGLFDYWRKEYPNSKIVLFFQDLVKTNKYKHPERLKDIFDLVLSFDHADCEKYGFTYYPLVYSKFDVDDDASIPESDIYFVGKAKNRLNDIIGIYELCVSAGLVCDFNIVGVPEQGQVYSDRINYCQQMPYGENLKRIKKTKCMLEIMQQGGHGYTLRYGEAISFGKRLITNNPEVVQAPFSNKELISVFVSANDFDVDFIKKGRRNVDYNYIDKISPIRLIEFVDRTLDDKVSH